MAYRDTHFNVNFSATISYEDGKQDYITKNVEYPTDHVMHSEITAAYVEFLAGCGFAVESVDDLNG